MAIETAAASEAFKSFKPATIQPTNEGWERSRQSVQGCEINEQPKDKPTAASSGDKLTINFS